MPDTATKWVQLNLKLTPEEAQRVEEARKRLAARTDPKFQVTTKTAFLAALERLEVYLAKLEKDKGRDR